MGLFSLQARISGGVEETTKIIHKKKDG